MNSPYMTRYVSEAGNDASHASKHAVGLRRCVASRSQEGMLSIEALYGDEHSPFHTLMSADVRGPLDGAALRAAIGHTTARHSSLRTVFARDDKGMLERLVLASCEPLIMEQTLPQLAADADPVEVVHAMIGSASAQLLRPYDRPPVAFVLSHVRRDRAVLSILAHHAVADGWSFGLLWQEIALRYGGLKAEFAVGPAPDMDVIVELERAAWANELAAARAATLIGLPAVAEIPSDVDRPQVRSLAGHRLTFGLTDSARAGCVKLTQVYGISRNVVLFAAWTLVIARMTGHEQLIMGVPVPSRSKSASWKAVGSGTNLAPVACGIPVHGNVSGYLRETARAVQDALIHRSIPFEDIVAELNLTSDRARNPLVQFAFASEDEVAPQFLGAGDVTFDIRVGHCGGSSYDATLFVLRWQPDPVLAIEYTASVLGPDEVARLAESFNTALEQLAAQPDGSLADVTTISAAERARLLALGAGPRAECSDGLWQLIEEVAERQPDAIAIRDREPEQTLTYRDLIAVACTQSGMLAAAGVGEGDCVALAVSRGIDEVVAVLAILRLGAAFTALTPQLPAEIAMTMLDAARVSVILGQPDLLSALGEVAGGRITLAVSSSIPAAQGQAVPPAAPGDAERIAYVAFTSGTTGTPKGTMVPCRAVVRLAANPSYLLPGACSRFMRFAPLAFDASTLEIFAPLLAGGAIEVFPADAVTPNELAWFLRDRQVTGLWLTAGLFRLVADYRPDGFSGVVQLLTGGDVVPPRQVADVLRACPGLRVTNGYGPTENTTFTTVYNLDHACEASAALPIGRPIQGTGVVVLDARGRLVPRGAHGELFAYGDGLAKGYAGLEQETAAAFGRFSLEGRALYATGDIVRWDRNGDLRFLGRRDHQAKVRGFRVELDHVTDVIRAHPQVRDVAVLIVGTDSGDQHLLAAVIPDGTPGPRPAVPAFAAGRLPRYAVPTRWAWVAEFPVTPNGKLDAGALAQIARGARPSAGARQDACPADRTEVGDFEAVIAQAWEDVLGHADFTADDWFFDVGGDSILLLRAHKVINQKLSSRELTVEDLYTYPTIAELASKIRNESLVESSRGGSEEWSS